MKGPYIVVCNQGPSGPLTQPGCCICCCYYVFSIACDSSTWIYQIYRNEWPPAKRPLKNNTNLHKGGKAVQKNLNAFLFCNYFVHFLPMCQRCEQAKCCQLLSFCVCVNNIEQILNADQIVCLLGIKDQEHCHWPMLSSNDCRARFQSRQPSFVTQHQNNSERNFFPRAFSWCYMFLYP